MNLDFAFRVSTIFGTLDVRQRTRLQSLVTIRRFDAGTTILRQGTSAVALYLILDGQVEVTREPADGGPAVTLATLKAGDVFGEMALLDPEPRLASVTAIEPTRLFRLAQAPFYELLSEQPEVAIGVIRVLTAYLRLRVQETAQLEARLRALAPNTGDPTHDGL